MIRRMVALAAAALLIGCGGDGSAEGSSRDEAATGSEAPEPSPQLSAQLDSGTVAYRDGRLEDALGHYRAAVDIDPHSASGWFGVHMAEKALGNAAAADSAMERARQLAPDQVPESHGDDVPSMYEHLPRDSVPSAAGAPVTGSST